MGGIVMLLRPDKVTNIRSSTNSVKLSSTQRKSIVVIFFIYKFKPTTNHFLQESAIHNIEMLELLLVDIPILTSIDQTTSNKAV